VHLSRKVQASEQRNRRTHGLDLRSTREILRAMNREDARVAPAVAREIGTIARAADAMARALASGSRVFYVGAGTSGRLATLDAAELPPTFGVPRGRVQAVLAGGKRALTEAVEGAEDCFLAGARAVAAKKISRQDVVIGITASGSTPYVLGALAKARQLGALTVGVSSHRRAPIARLVRILIAPRTGAEVIAGSTRLKAGTAQKLVLNMLSTAAMVRWGRVYDNWMIGVALANRKLLRRSERILEQAAGASVSRAARALRQAEHDARIALIMLKMDVDRETARERLRRAGDHLRTALGEKPAARLARARR
jgi:N-acetylmuramic acid 6-phosphate etherase